MEWAANPMQPHLVATLLQASLDGLLTFLALLQIDLLPTLRPKLLQEPRMDLEC